jgi:LEA14-like dessication related protein
MSTRTGRNLLRAATGATATATATAACLLVLLLGGCHLLVPKLQPPGVTVTGVNLQGGNLRGQHLQVYLHVENPNDRTIAVESLTAHLDLAGQPFATGVSDQPFTLPSLGATDIVVDVTADMSNALVIAAAAISHSMIDYRLYGEVHLAHSLVTTLNFAHSGRLRL